ncbi:MAG: hypothetical protein M3O92_02935 [Actinomycetota bacterium]|nr:hypothetical protein [Actinomycetota bacterium]
MSGDPLRREDDRDAPADTAERDSRPSALEEELRVLAEGREERTPFVLFAGVNAFLLALALVIAVVALLAWWLA